MQRSHVPGMTIAIVKDGKFLRTAGYGWSDLERCVAVTDDTLFGIGSISKEFTAAGVMALVNRGRLSLDDPIVKYLPEGANRWQGITVRHLLTHTSGIKDYADDDDRHPTIHPDRASNISTADLVALFAQPSLNFAPGSDWAYSNTGYLLLSVIVERVSGQPFPQFMHDNVFAPLGMSSTRYYSARESVPNRATPYHVADGTVTKGQYVSDQFSRWGDAGMISTGGDMAKWAVAMISGTVFPATTWSAMTAPVRLNDGTPIPYGFGLYLDEVGTSRILSHSGTFRPGYSADLVVFPEKRLAVVALSNYWSARERTPTIDVARAVATSVDLSLARDKRAPALDPQPELTQKLLDFLRAKNRDDYLAAPAAFAHLGVPPALPAKSLTFIACDPVNDDAPGALGSHAVRECTYRLQSEGGPPTITFLLTSDDKVAGLSRW